MVLLPGTVGRIGGSGAEQPDYLEGSTSLKRDPADNYIHYGVREFGMTAMPTASTPRRLCAVTAVSDVCRICA